MKAVLNVPEVVGVGEAILVRGRDIVSALISQQNMTMLLQYEQSK